MKSIFTKPKDYFFVLFSVTFLFCFAIGIDATPLLRGPAPYPPEWQWEYFFVNTLSKIYLPLLVIFLLTGFYWLVEKRNFFSPSVGGKTKLFLTILILLSFSFQMSLLFFSRSGIPVLIHRVINPGLNSYFSASLSIHNPIDFLNNYEQEMKAFTYHARSHPPGATLIFYGFKQIVAPITPFVDFVKNINPTHQDVRQIWNTLLPIDKATAVFSAFFIPFLSTLTLIPLFYAGKKLYGEKVAIRSAFIFTLLPSIIFFIPINDVFLPFFSILSFLFLFKGLEKNSLIFFFLSGTILFFGVFFNLALLPLSLLFFIYSILYIKRGNLNLKKYIAGGGVFGVGLILVPVLLYLLLNFNFITLIQTIFSEVPHVHTRSYTLWLFYNLYDFFVFAGIPLAIIFFTQIKKFNKSDLLFVSFFITLIIIDLTGSTRGETGRIWAPYLPFLVLPVIAFVTDKIKFSTKLFVGLLLIQSLQILVMQEFWVMLW